MARSSDMYSADSSKRRQTIQAGVDSCVLELARDLAGAVSVQTVGEAWEVILGEVDQQTTVAIHVTCFYVDRFSFNSPQLETLQAVVTGLCQMLSGGFPAGNIRVFDNDMGGINRIQGVYGTASLDALGVAWTQNTFDGGSPMTVNGRKLYPHTYLSSARYGINLARLSGHQFAPGSGPGISGCVKGKVRLNLLDMVRASQHERLAFGKNVGEICAGQDPCAVDGYASARLGQLWPDTPYAGLSIPTAVATIDPRWSTQYSKIDCPIPARTDSTAPLAPTDVRVRII